MIITNYLDVRNDDLRWVLSDSQYRRFLGLDYFYRPIYANTGGWNFRVYITYTNHNTSTSLNLIIIVVIPEDITGHIFIM